LLSVCVEAKGEDIEAMTEKAREISCKTFSRHCDTEELERSLGYGAWLRMANDYAVSFYKSKYCGKPCYYLDHSRIEHVFLP